jgi:carbon starvation protein
VQELFGLKGKTGAIIGTLATIVVPFICVLIAPKGSWNDFWTLFGASNQLLAALTLLSITVWLYQARQRIAFTLLPMLFVLVITIWALGSLVVGNFRAANGFDIKFVNGLASLTLIGLAVYLVIAALFKLKGERGGELATEGI